MRENNHPLLELLAPAGDMERLQMAVSYGADAVYLAGSAFGMRAFAGNFTGDELHQAVQYCHQRGVACHVTINTMPRNNEIAQLPAWLETLEDAGVDAVIVADLGAFTLAGKYAPHVKRHISTQASISNYETARAWHDLGASRVILARELSLDEVAELRAKTPRELEIEAFAHGAMCVSYSGRCLLSNYMTGRDSNRGACAQPCRYQYHLVEEKRPGEYFPVFEDEKGTYIMNSRDMCMIDHVQELYDVGLNSLKIEGRAKSAYYAAIVTGAYRHVIDDVKAGRPVDLDWRNEVDKVSHRHYSTGFWFGQPGQYYDDARYLRDWQVCAIVQSCDEQGLAVLSLRNKFRAGDAVEIVGPDAKPVSFQAPVMEEEDGAPLEEPRHPQMLFRMQLPKPVLPLSILRRAVELSPGRGE
ncbi:MAG: U32 family peptidase [Candidatus Onthomonas sp.]